MVRLCAFALLLLPTLSFAEKQIYDVYFGGTKSGEAVGEIGPDGMVTSTLDLKIGTIKIASSLTGHIQGGLLVDYTLDASQAGTSSKIVWKDGKYSVESAGKVVAKDKSYKPGLKAALSIFHPVLNGLFWKEFRGEAKKTKTLFVDSFVEIEPDFRIRTVNLMVAGSMQPIALVSAELGTVGMTWAFSSDGRPLGVEVPSQKVSWVLRGYEGVFVDPLAKYPELSQPTYRVTNERRVRMAARDGVRLMADIARPQSPGRFPTILIRTPYGRATSLAAEEWYARRGYVVVSQDVRGRGGSDGEWDPLVHERKDGQDTLDWIVQQPWSDGQVGMIGGSYLAYVQWAAATTHHPALKCIIPQVSPTQPDMNFPWDNGAFMLIANLWWCRVAKDRSSTTDQAFAKLKNLDALLTLPVSKADDRFFGTSVPFFDRWLRQRTLADWGDVFTTDDVATVRIPALHLSGIWDGDGIGTALHWQVRRNPNDRLFFGPWTHLFNTSHKFGDQEYGSDAILELDSVYLRFFDTWLKGRTVQQDRQPRVSMFVTGANRWIRTSEWPMPGAQPRTLYLGGGTTAGTLAATKGHAKSSYAYKPNKPAFDKKELDVNPAGASTVVGKARNSSSRLVFRSAPFDRDTALAAPIQAELYISSTARDATFIVTVCDEDPSGVCRLVGMPGTQRATYAEGRYTLLTPGKVAKVQVEPWWFCHRFKKGHRLVVSVSSDEYPRFARNPGTGEPEWKATKLLDARHTVWMTERYPSRVTFWELPKGSW